MGDLFGKGGEWKRWYFYFLSLFRRIMYLQIKDITRQIWTRISVHGAEGEARYVETTGVKGSRSLMIFAYVYNS